MKTLPTLIAAAMAYAALVGCNRTTHCSEVEMELARPGVAAAVEAWTDETYSRWNAGDKSRDRGHLLSIGAFSIPAQMQANPLPFGGDAEVRLLVNANDEPTSMFVGDRNAQGIIVLLEGSREIGVPGVPDSKLRRITPRVHQVCLSRD